MSVLSIIPGFSGNQPMLLVLDHLFSTQISPFSKSNFASVFSDTMGNCGLLYYQVETWRTLRGIGPVLRGLLLEGGKGGVHPGVSREGR